MRGLIADAHSRLLRAMRATIAADPWFDGWADRAGDPAAPSLVIEDFSSEPWASLTFRGMRHTLAIRLHGAQNAVETAYDRLEAMLEEPDLALPGHFLAELERVESNGEIHFDGSMTLGIHFEALTIEE